MSDTFCPKCSVPMATWNAGELEIDHCSRCKGLWFDANELTRHLANSGAPRLGQHPEAGAATTYACPKCEDERLLGTFLLDVSVESCPKCDGVFLDLGEIYELLGSLDPPARAAKPGSSLSGFDNFALGLFVGMRHGSGRK